jgi:hypothetical protein
MIYEKTTEGIKAFQEKSAALSSKLRSILIMVDGKRSSTDLLTVLAGIGANQEQLAELLKLGLIRAQADQDKALPASKPTTASASSQTDQQPVLDIGTDQQRYQAAYPIATRLTSGLGLRGFRLNLSVEGASSLKDLILLAGKIRDAVGEER